ncbi:uncharacterized protein LOC107038249 isoform X2 [Diachasma alloeum]|uniref:uncharacterized protein LOC107038249 isoform X2 n=1 Tax=Diachasma alloeum TaxID=454923 RepID=UPI00073839ED|nr:uncharacterized protein LOC107038249 isoform X2 [Diachasma alloeum]
MSESTGATVPSNRHKRNGRFIKKSQQEYREKRLEALKQHNSQRQEDAVPSDSEMNASPSKCILRGRRIMDMGYVTEQMSCNSCRSLLCFSRIEAETKIGLASIFKIRCDECSEVKSVYTSRNFPRDNDRSYEVNCKAVTCSVASGINHRQLMKLLADINVPFPSEASLRAAEKRKRGEATAEEATPEKNVKENPTAEASSAKELTSPGSTADADDLSIETPRG